MNGPVQVATDGACPGNPGPGGWAWTTGSTDASGGQRVTTNPEMELRAILEALRAHPHQPIIEAIAEERDRRPVQLVKVPGHAGHPLNERADQLAAAAAARVARAPR